MATTFNELKGDPRRQAVPSIRGTVYQAWCSIDAWLRLSNAEQAIYLEGAEDFDVIGGEGGDIAVQVKNTSSSISLGNAKAHEALENFWALAQREPSRNVSMHYLTTSAVAIEQDANFGGLRGLDAWRAARTNPDLALAVAKYVASKLGTNGPLGKFLASTEAIDFQEQILNRFHWFTDQPDIQTVQRSVDDRISVLLVGQQRSTSLTRGVRIQLESRFWEVITEKNSVLRCLTFGDLLRQVELATTAYLPLPLDKLPELLAGTSPGLGLLKLLIQKAPRAPKPLVPRIPLTLQVGSAVNERRAVLLTGTVYKGKTTLAQQVVQTQCPDAWWVNMTDRRPDQVDNVLLALAGEIEGGGCPDLVVIDDLDISPASFRAYENSLSLVLHRAQGSGRGIILTAQGSSAESTQLSSMGNLEVIKIPELSREEIKELCIQEGCRTEYADAWSFTILALTRGHPKLVQVRLIELSEQQWPKPSSSSLVAPSPAAQSVRQLARQLLAQSVSADVAELLYCASESSVLLHRSVMLTLAELIGLKNGGDVLDSLTGAWIEKLEDDWHRTTPLLQGTAADVWTAERRQMAHIQLHDAILRRETLSPSEAAALLYHSFFGRDWARVALNSLRLQIIDDEKARRELERNLMWLPYVALDKGQLITESARTGVALRSLQFRVALTIDADTLPQICDRWAEELLQVSEVALAEGMQALMWNSVAISDTRKVPLRHRLAAIKGLTTLTGEMRRLGLDGTTRFLESNSGNHGIPSNGTQTQLLLAMTTRWVRGINALSELVQWLDTDATDEIRSEFESIFDWPLVQTAGSFVHGAWAADHESVLDWSPWLGIFDAIGEYAIRRTSLNFGREAAKATSIVLCESLDDSEGALRALALAEERFGKSPVLDEQRANVLFQGQDDEGVLTIWADLMGRSRTDAVQDPFAYRRAAISAWRLRRWTQSIDTFRAGAHLLEPSGFPLTRFGLLVDCALVEIQASRVPDAARTLAQAVLGLPAEASENDERWEPVQRAAVEVLRCIENFLWKPQESTAKFEPGYASSPGRKIEKAVPGQAGRHLLLRAQCSRMAATHGLALPEIEQELDFLLTTPYRYVRWTAAEGRLAYSFGNGKNFMNSLVGFDFAISSLVGAKRGPSIVMPDESPDMTTAPQPERWLGLIVAAAWLSGVSLEATLRDWSNWLDSRVENLKLQQLLGEILEGVGPTPVEPEKLKKSAQRPPPVRCGAMLGRLLGPITMTERFQIWNFLVSAIVSDESFARQDVFNLHLAKHICKEVKELCASPFNFNAPNREIPVLLEATRTVESGQGTLKTIMSAIHRISSQTDPEHMSRVW